MQSVLSVQAARADKAIEKREVESTKQDNVNATWRWEWWEVLGQPG